MRLSEQEYYQFLGLHTRLIYFVGQKKGLLPRTESYADFMRTSFRHKIESRDAVYENIDLIEDLIEANKTDFSEDDKSILRGFKDFYAKDFFIVEYTKKHTLFHDDKYVFSVLALSDPLHTIAGPDLPKRVSAILLPFKGKIVYDGMLKGSSMHFGRNISASIKNDLELAKAKYGIIEQLPIAVKEPNIKLALEKQLNAMMKTKASRDYNEFEIDDLLTNNPHLLPLYSSELGRIHSRAKKKVLKELGIQKRHFAVYEDTILCSAENSTELNKMVHGMVKNAEQRKGVYVFKI